MHTGRSALLSSNLILSFSSLGVFGGFRSLGARGRVPAVHPLEVGEARILHLQRIRQFVKLGLLSELAVHCFIVFLTSCSNSCGQVYARVNSTV